MFENPGEDGLHDEREAVAEITLEELQRIVDRANTGDAAALSSLRRVLAETPEIWRKVGDLAKHTEAVGIAMIAGEDLLLSELLVKKLADLREQLLGDDDTPLVRIGVERIVAAWLQIQVCEKILLTVAPGSPTGKFWLQRLALADRMHRAGLKDLAALRRAGLDQSSRFVWPQLRVV